MSRSSRPVPPSNPGRAPRGASATALAGLLLALTAAVPARAAAAPRLELRHGDHVAIVGNTLADRMQHDGWLEAFLHARFPNHDLTVRNLGFSGDELT